MKAEKILTDLKKKRRYVKVQIKELRAFQFFFLEIQKKSTFRQFGNKNA